MKYFYVDSTGYVSNVLFDSLSRCLDDIRSTFTLKSFSDVSYFSIYALRSFRSADSLITPMYTVSRDGLILDNHFSEVGRNFKVF